MIPDIMGPADQLNGQAMEFILKMEEILLPLSRCRHLSKTHLSQNLL